jgi:hypothetical protein
LNTLTEHSRFVIVPHWGEFQVPRHVVRIDIDDPGLAGTHGWQVRYPHRAASKLFSDGKGNPKTSLIQAKAYLAAMWQGPSPRLHYRERGNKRWALGVPGIHINVQKKTSRNVYEFRLIVTPPLRNKLPIHFYLGTENTATAERFDAALNKALALRLRLIREHEAALRRS